ncbi:MAG TPA: DNA polymerase III subunit gamma/tau [Phycisphaerae bacterium]|nr:DNA polymerase III subunit gamma/tau [Phycisphaerae bacterium]
MAYKVLARKYRSWTFDELVGQEAVATTLKNAIQTQRLHHGYLFCGTRGVGKTSAARILARSLNCLSFDQPTVEPCRTCESCVAIAEGQDVDVIEIDAASNTGVDNIRELRSNTLYRPARARFKIYIIDEVHMLSTGAFNALLKTLEEPPGHVKFIMATTEAKKVPATIQSRCLRFDFRSIPAEKIAAHFEHILQQEQIEVDPQVIRRVARLANGSMRDGLSLLDQLLSLGADKLTMDMLDDVLPVSYDATLTQLVEQLAEHDAGGALVTLDACLASGYSLERFAEALAEQVRTLMLLNVCGPTTNLVELPPAVAERMIELSKRFDQEAYVFMISVLEELRRNIRFSALGRALTEAALVRLASGTSYRSVQSLLAQLESGGTVGVAAPAGQAASGPRPMASAAPAAAPVAPVAPPAPAVPRPTPAPPATPRSPAPPVARPEPAPSRPAKPPASSGKQALPGKPATPARSVPKPPTPEDLRAATSEPLVREAMDLFQATLVNVERQEQPKQKE